MRVLFIGGTGLISSACAELALQRGHELTLLNRSSSRKYPAPQGARVIAADVHDDPGRLRGLLADQRFDAVVDFIAFDAADIERDIELFRGRAQQFVFISSASAYQKPPQHYIVTESTPLENPYWQYARDKIACERRLMQAHRDEGFPVTIIRPSLTYGPSQIALPVNSWAHPWTALDRMLRGKPVIVPGDGTSLWVVTWNADFAKGLIGLLGRPEAIGEAYQITSDDVLTWEQIHLGVYRALGAEPNILHVPTDVIAEYWPHASGSLAGDKIHSLVFDNAKIKKLVPDFTCEVNWDEGAQRVVEWHGLHPEFQTVDADFDRMLDALAAGSQRARPGA